MSTWISALQYVKNTNGGATRQNFLDDHEPIGPRLWEVLFEEKNFITIDSAGKLFLSADGAAALANKDWKP